MDNILDTLQAFIEKIVEAINKEFHHSYSAGCRKRISFYLKKLRTVTS